MEKIGIVTLFDYFNIGNKLQNYALEKIISDLGYEPITVVCSDYLQKKCWKDHIKILMGRFLKKYRSSLMNEKRYVRFKKETNFLIVTTEFMTWKEIQQKRDMGYKAFVVGSDQVWFNWQKIDGELEFRFLTFVEKRKRICFAPSFGRDDIDEQNIDVYRNWLNGFERLSCREKSGCDLIYRITGRKSELLCDPTMMLNKEQWNQISRKPIYELPTKYVMLYFLSEPSKDQLALIHKYASDNQCQIVDVYNVNYPQYYYTTPQEFLYCIEHAAYVFTNSFHGTVFSILFHKQFVVFSRNDIQARMNNRCITLLQKFQIQNHLNNISNEKINYRVIDELLKAEREKSLMYLQEELKRAITGDEVDG